MSEPTCACGNIDGANAECERCRLIAQLTAAQQRVAELEADILDHKTVLRDKRTRIEQLKQRINDMEQADDHLMDCAQKRVNKLTAENARLQAAIRELIKTLRINCPHGNAVADCYDIPTYTGAE